METDPFARLRDEIMRHESNKAYTDRGYAPLFTGSSQARIVIVGQAPGIRAQTSAKPWDDASGLKLMQWLGVDETQFRDSSLIAHIPMDFYYPGKGKSGDLPPRKDFAPLWHPRLLALMPDVELIVLIGNYAQRHYLGSRAHKTLTETVRDCQAYLPDFFPVVHPSPLNFRWFGRNPWFEIEVLPVLQARVGSIIGGKL